MAIRRIFEANEPVLRRKAGPVKKIDRVIWRLLDDMVETMYHFQGVGLAAPQVGVPKRIVVLDPGGEENRLMELINPHFRERSGEVLGVEGCLSLPGITGEVPRAERVVVEALDREGCPVRIEAEGLPARILQHEIDHLDGILIIDRAVRLLDPEEEEEEES